MNKISLDTSAIHPRIIYKQKRNCLSMKTLLENLRKTDKIIEELKKSLEEEVLWKIIRSHNRGKTEEYLRLIETQKNNQPIDKESFNRFDLYRWKRGTYPDTIKTIRKIYCLGLHRIDKKILSRLIGWGFGDGGINNKLGYYFICGNKNDLEKIKKYVHKEIPKIKIKIEENKSTGKITSVKNKVPRRIFGKKSWILYVKNSTFVRFLYGNGLPKGEKVLQRISVPTWIINGDKEIKLEFLEGLLECENQKHSVKFNKLKNKVEIPVVSFGMCKEVKYKENLVEFLNSIKTMLEEFNIRCGGVEVPKPNNIRKRDGKITYLSRFSIYTSILDVINFSRVINYRFNDEKRRGLNIAVKEAKNKLKRFEQQKIKFEKAKELFKGGMNYSKISHKLNVSHITIKHWVVGKEHLPRHLDIDIGGILNG